MMRKEADTLIDKLVASVLYQISMKTCAELINFEKEIDPLLAEYVMNYSNLTSGEISFRKAFLGEFNVGIAPIVRNLDSPRGFLDLKIDREDIQKANPPFAKANQMLNYRFLQDKNLSELSELPAQEFYQTFDTMESVPIHWVNYINNPIGLIMSPIYDSPAYKKHLMMSQDIQMYQNLLKVAAAIKSLKIEQEKIPEFLETNKDKWGNFYTGEALTWNADTRELSFSGPFQEEKAKERILKLK
jgi:hypothetical protein